MTTATLQNCSKCGLCLSVCPVYKVLMEEQTSPRAKLQLVKYYENKELASSKSLKDIISKCLMCGNCSAVCPSGINHYSQFMDIRAQMVKNHGENLAIKSLIYLLADEYRTKLAAGVAKFSQKIIPSHFIKKYNMGSIPLKRLPKLNKMPFRQSYQANILPSKKQKGIVLYFTGCATNYIFDKTGFATVNILKQMGYQVIIPEKQTCCGLPLLFHGASDKAGKNILTNIECFTLGNIKAIIVDCPTCGSALKNEYPAWLKKNNLDTTQALKISHKVIDIMTFVLQESNSFKNLNLPAKPTRFKVTYHLPCHLKNNLTTSNNTEIILNNLPFIDYIRVPDFDKCCGGGGTFFYEYPGIARTMVKTKTDNIEKSGADILLTDCPVCRINLAGNLQDQDKIVVKHPIEVIINNENKT